MDDIITLDYGSGGKKTASLIDEIIVPALSNSALSELGDGAVIEGAENLVFSTDSFVVTPYFFPGGDIGKLSICGTVNDIAMAGGCPKYISLAMIIEEGFPTEDLRKIVSSIAKQAEAIGVNVVTGDTKVVERGRGDGIYINTAGIGFLQCPGLSPKKIQKGDAVIISGTVGDHGTAVMLARNPGFSGGTLTSDCAALSRMASKLYGLKDSLRVLRDPTRGGLATTLCEFVDGTGLGIELTEESIPVRPEVKTACDLLGLDPLYSANEGKMIAIVEPSKAAEALELLRSDDHGRDAEIIGYVTDNHPGLVTLKTPIGGSRIVTRLTGAQLPRIC